MDGNIVGVFIAVMIAGAIIVSGGLAAQFATINWYNETSGVGDKLMGTIMPFVPLGIGLVVVAYAFKKSGIKI